MLFVYWSDGTYCPLDEFVPSEWSYMSDDYELVTLDQLAGLIGVTAEELICEYY